MEKTQELEAMQTDELGRSPAQFFFEVGFGAAFAEAMIRNDMQPPFEFSDALVERAWEIAQESYEDPAEFDRFLALANGEETRPREDATGAVTKAVELVYRIEAAGAIEYEGMNFERWKADAREIAPALRALSPAAPPAAAFPALSDQQRMGEDTKLLNVLRDECWDLRCLNVSTGGDDYEVDWKVVGHWQAEPCEREIARGYSDDPRAAIKAALASQRENGEQGEDQPR